MTITNKVSAMPDALSDALLAAIHAENLARSAANAAEPYVHADYAVHEQRIYRLVDALADGDQVLADRFNDALFDITHDGLAWMRQTYARLARDVADEAGPTCCGLPAGHTHREGRGL